MKRKTCIVIILILLSFGSAGILIAMNEVDQQSENNTVEHTATVCDVQTTNMNGERYADIFTEEYTSSLYISTNVGKNIDLHDLQKGDKIVFRVENEKNNQLNKAAFINIVSLKCEDEVYLSLADYNLYMEEATKPARISIGILAVLSLSFALYFALKRSKT